MESEHEIRERLVGLHGKPIVEERGGIVHREQARMLLDILGIEYSSLEGRRKGDFVDRQIRCVDLSDCLDIVEPYE